MRDRGITLLETLLYVVAASIMLYAVANIYGLVFSQDASMHAQRVVDDASVHALRIITDALRSADAVTEPAEGTTGSRLVLDVNGATTEFFVDNDVLYVREGLSDNALTPEDVQMGNIVFEHVPGATSSNMVHVQFAARYRHGLTGRETEYITAYYGGASTR